MEELFEFSPKFTAKSTVDKEIDGGVEGHQQIGDLKGGLFSTGMHFYGRDSEAKMDYKMFMIQI